MPVALLIQLLTALGPELVQIPGLVTSLIQKFETNGSVSSSEWQSVETKAKQTASDRMLLALKNANIDPASPEGAALLAGSK